MVDTINKDNWTKSPVTDYLRIICRHDNGKPTNVLRCSIIQSYHQFYVYSYDPLNSLRPSIRVGKVTIIGFDNDLLPGRRRAIIWNSVGILLIGHVGMDFSELLTGIKTVSFRRMHLKMSSAKWRPFCLGLNHMLQECFTGTGTSLGLPQCQYNDSQYPTHSLAHGKCGSNFRNSIFKLIFKLIQNCGLGPRCEIALSWMPEDPTNERSTLVQVILRMPPGNKVLFEPILTHRYVAIWRH